MVEITRQPELEVKSEDVTQLQFHDKIWTDKLLLMDEQGKWSLAIESTSGESATKIIETTTRNLEYYIVHEKKYFERNLLFFSLSSRSQ